MAHRGGLKSVAMRTGRPAESNGGARGRDPRLAARDSDRAEQVYQAALRLFRQKGYHATSMQDIAEAVGLYKGSLYHYINSKEDLLLHAFERAMDSLLVEIEEVVRDTQLDPATQLRRAIRAHVAAVAENLDALAVYLHEWRGFAGDQAATVTAQSERYEALLGGIIRRGVEAGQFKESDVKVSTLGVLGMCNWLYHWYNPSGRLGPAQIADTFADFVLDGLRAKT